ncbi:MAG TPA: F0F1 ATP synthase subunit B [Candidatus Saccharimonadales bacterium]|nr:F0F1 ATP synthase subunit B [Candidatus Saccharimonadales bacterium]
MTDLLYSPLGYLAAAGPNLFQGLGINWELLVVQAGAFLILMWVLGKFVYPYIINSIDERRKTIEDGLANAKKAEDNLKTAEEKTAAMLMKARAEADEIIKRGQQEAMSAIEAAEDKAKLRTAQIIEDGRRQLQVDIEAARKALRKETVSFVSMATEQIIHEKLDVEKDAALIRKVIDKKESA